MSTQPDTGVLMVALEPPGGEGGAAPGRGSVAGAADAATSGAALAADAGPGAALAAEAARLAEGLGLGLRRVTWDAAPDQDLDAVAAALAGAAERARATAILLADTDTGRQLAPLLAHRMGSGAVIGCSDVASWDGTLVFVKPVYGGWLEQEIEPAPGTIPVATLDLAGLEAPAAAPSAAPHEAPTLEVLAVAGAAEPRVRSLELVPPDPRSVDLVHARRIVAAGSGSASESLLEAVRELADLIGGSVGATRPVVDDGRIAKERLIGQTGRTVTPDLYLALGISGSPHHVAGVRGAERIIAVNRDVRAPIFQFSDVGYVADLETVLPALVRKIEEWRDARG